MESWTSANHLQPRLPQEEQHGAQTGSSEHSLVELKRSIHSKLEAFLNSISFLCNLTHFQGNSEILIKFIETRKVFDILFLGQKQRRVFQMRHLTLPIMQFYQLPALGPDAKHDHKGQNIRAGVSSPYLGVNYTHTRA